MRRYIQYEKATGKTQITPPMTEDDVLQTPSDYLLFATKEELQKCKTCVSRPLPAPPVLPDALQIQNHNNLLQSHPDAIEMTGDIIEKKRGHGGKRSGAGRKKGYRLSDTTKESIATAMKGNQNASKKRETANTPE